MRVAVLGAGIIAAAVCLASYTWAIDAQGRYAVGGGVGALQCPEFLSAMAETRGFGGPHTAAGAQDQRMGDVPARL